MDKFCEINTPFLKIKDAATATGLSQFYLRNGCKAGIVPHVLSGNTFYVNVPALLRQLGCVEVGEKGEE